MMRLDVEMFSVDELLDHIPVGLIVYKTICDSSSAICDFECLSVNTYAATVLRRNQADLIGRRYLELFPGEPSARMFKAYVKVLESGECLREERFFPANTAADKLGKWFSIRANKLNDSLIISFEDITQRKAFEGQLKDLAYHDDLTGLYNRRYFFEYVAKTLALARRKSWPVALLYLDLNGFKAVNDQYGHSTGDRLLKDIVSRLRRSKRKEDFFVRMGGDEFVLFMPDTSKLMAMRVAQRVSSELLEPFHLDGISLGIDASIGVAADEGATATLDGLLQQADQRMYRAKQNRQSGKSSIAY